MRDRRIEHLRRVELFATLPRRAIELVARHAEVVRVPAGTTLVSQGQIGHEFYVVADGVAGVVRDSVEVARLGAGDSFGELALLRHAPRNATVVAITDLEVVLVPERAFFGLLSEVPELAGRLLTRMAARLQAADAATAGR